MSLRCRPCVALTRRLIIKIAATSEVRISLVDYSRALLLQANQILGLAPGEVFVQRNIGNLATHKDLNCMTCLEYAVSVLKVKHVIICGHYNCGAIRGALTMSGKTPGLTNLWISDIKDTRNKHAEQLGNLEGDEQMNRYFHHQDELLLKAL